MFHKKLKYFYDQNFKLSKIMNLRRIFNFSSDAPQYLNLIKLMTWLHVKFWKQFDSFFSDWSFFINFCIAQIDSIFQITAILARFVINNPPIYWISTRLLFSNSIFRLTIVFFFSAKNGFVFGTFSIIRLAKKGWFQSFVTFKKSSIIIFFNRNILRFHT